MLKPSLTFSRQVLTRKPHARISPAKKLHFPDTLTQEGSSPLALQLPARMC